jgi:hypothetical protein
MQPGETAIAADAGLVEAGHRRGGDPAGDDRSSRSMIPRAVRLTQHVTVAAASRVRHHRAARADHQAGQRPDPLGRDRGRPEDPRLGRLAGLLSGPDRRTSRGRNIATVAVARKLLTLVYYGLRDGHIRALAPAEAAA